MSAGKMARPAQQHYDVVIVGGAMLGSSVAWFLANHPDFDGSVLLVERDPGYTNCSTSHTNSCIRQQFSSELNIRISQFAAEFVNNFRDFMGDADSVPQLAIQNFGYLYLASNAEFANALRAAHAVQAACGAGTRLFTRDELQTKFPFYQLDDIVLGSLNTVNEGYWDGITVFDHFRRAARRLGAEFVVNEVVDMTLNQGEDRIESVQLATGETVRCNHVVNATGPRAAATSRMAGIELPVEPRKRFTYVFSAAKPLQDILPLTIDPSGVHVRSDGEYYMAGCAPLIDTAVDYDDFAHDEMLWEEKVWPTIAARIPQFDAIRQVNSWVGHYAYNTLDQNAIVGPHSRIRNFLFANGFSGHGLQKAPAVGRGIAELITFGEYRSLDLSPLGFERIERGEPLLEKAVI